MICDLSKLKSMTIIFFLCQQVSALFLCKVGGFVKNRAITPIKIKGNKVKKNKWQTYCHYFKSRSTSNDGINK